MNILFVGASGYGNLGDDAYKEIFSDNLKDHNVLFDSPYPDLKAVDWCDILVVGGGGLIYNNETAHFEYMKMYMDRAIDQYKKICFISCGVQVKTKGNELDTEPLKVWKPYLDYASVITLRSYKDKDLLQQITTTKIEVYPDLCYLIKPVDYHLTLPNSVVLVLTNSVYKEGNTSKLLSKYQGENLYTVLMSNDDKEVTNIFLNTLLSHDHFINRDNLTPREAARIFADAKVVISSRYHSNVFSRAVGCEDIIHLDKRYKSLYEPKWTDEELPSANMHIEALRRELDE